MAVVLFVDTNTYLHYQPIEQIDSRSLVGGEDVLIVVPQMVLHELDKQKDSGGSSKVRERAQRALKTLWGQHQKGSEAELRRGVRVELESDEAFEDCARSGLAPERQDNHVLARACAYQADHQSVDVRIATNDTGLKVRAGAKRIAVLELADEMKLPAEEDPEKKENRELRRRIAEIEAASPKLKLTFAGGAPYAQVSLPPAVKIDEDRLSEKMAEIRRAYPEMPSLMERVTAGVVGQPALYPSTDLYSPLIPDTEILRYNLDLKKFYAEYEQYLRAAWECKDASRRTAAVELVLSNEGTTPALDMDVELWFPAGVKAYRKRSLLRTPEQPRPPSKPQPSPYLAEIFPRPTFCISDQFAAPRNLSGVRILSEHPGHALITIERLKHGKESALESIYIIVDGEGNVGGFQIAYALRAANLPRAETGELSVRIDPVSPAAPGEGS